MFIILLCATTALKIASFCYDREIMISVLGVVALENSHKSFLLFKNSIIKSSCTPPPPPPPPLACCVVASSKSLPPPSYSSVSRLGPPDQLHGLNYRAKKSLSGIKIQGIDGAIDTLQLSIVSSPVHMSTGVVKPACCFQVSSPVQSTTPLSY